MRSGPFPARLQVERLESIQHLGHAGAYLIPLRAERLDLLGFMPGGGEIFAERADLLVQAFVVRPRLRQLLPGPLQNLHQPADLLGQAVHGGEVDVLGRL